MIRVLQLIDSLNAGGAERLSVSLANALAVRVDESFLCATRSEGILKSTVNASVGYSFLQKKTSLDFKAIFKLRKFIKENKINVVHAHSTSFFLATLMKVIFPKLKLIWHDHYGKSEYLEQRPKLVLRLCSYVFNHIFCVNRHLLEWSKENLKCKSVSYLQNFIVPNEGQPITQLKGNKGKRIVCLANLRPQKDHMTLLKAFEMVIKKYPDWTLHCVGQDFNDSYADQLYGYVKEHHLKEHVYFYGSCLDINHILSQSTIGVLSSKSEGLPIALLEYGFSKLAVVVTNVGDCNLVIDSDDKGLMVNPQDPKAIMKALCTLIEDESKRLTFSENLHESILQNFTEKNIVHQILKVYQSI